jgi:CDP-diacylglycerol--glycerol-3-phosphate 3-phosphatidyltransferase
MTPSLLVLATVLGAAFLSMVVYAARGRARDHDAVKKGSSLLLGAGDFLVHWFLWAIAPAERLFFRMGATPDHFNAAGLLLGLAAGLLIAFAQVEAGGWAIALAGVCDILDGRMARARGLASAYGKFIDSTLDRFVETFAFLGFAWLLRDTAAGAPLAGAALAASLLVSYAQARGETVQVSGSGGLMQRAERLVLTCLACLFDAPVCAFVGWPLRSLILGMLALVAAGAFATAVHRTVWIARRLKEREADRKAAGGGAPGDPP